VIQTATPADVRAAVNREAWLKECGVALKEVIEPVASKMIPPFRISCGWPTRNALSTKRQTIGQCWDGMVSGDGTVELFISPVLDDPLGVCATVAHELVHAVVGTEHGHKKPFADVAKGIGLKGKMTATVAGEEFIARVEPIVRQLGKYPHSAMTPKVGHKPAGTRLLKCSCTGCGYVIRTTAVHIERQGTPICSCNMTRMTAPDGFDSDGGGDE
jgi:hypothetical protein